MLGAHVRTVDQFNWIQQSQGIVLQIPGSYWLCHKKNLYKFIFRYHRTNRDVEEFKFGKELMKVIRKIIKCKPCQGQQFGTQHLLITFNRASWTRRDKMFAILKFKEKTDATTFSYAFILTIKILCPSEREIFGKNELEKNINTNKSVVCRNQNSDNVHKFKVEKNENSKRYLLRHSENDHMQNDEHCEYDAIEHVSKLDICNDKNNACISERKLAEQISMDVANTKSSTNKLNISSSRPVRTFDNAVEDNLKLDDKTKQTRSVGHNRPLIKNRREKCSNNSKMSLNSNINGMEEDNIIFNESQQLNCSETNGKEQKSYESSVNCKKGSMPINNEVQSDNNHVHGEGIVDSANLPYQYLIEKEIETTKNKKTLRSEIPLKNVENNTELLNKNTKEAIREICMDEETERKWKLSDRNDYINGKRNESEPFPKRRKVMENDKVSRSSDITNLVMEGLMFTIRQGQDSIAVIEQKTKLETDEVLENSEKFVTKEGEEGLRNSSLLGLENLITTIELPKRPGRKYKHTETIDQENISEFKLSMDTSFYSNTRHCYPSHNYIKEQQRTGKIESLNQQKYFNNSDSLASSTSSTNFDHQIYLKGKLYREKEAREYIIPERLPHSIIQSSRFSTEETNIPGRFELQTSTLNENDITYKTSINEEMLNGIKEMKRDNSFNSDSVRGTNISLLSKFDDVSRYRLSGPKIVSNQVITVDQIPLPIQKVLKNKLTHEEVPPSDKSIITPTSDTEDSTTMFPKNDIISDKLHSESVNCDTPENRDTAKSPAFTHDKNRLQYKSKSDSKLLEEQNIHTLRKSTLKTSETSTQSRLQNITEDFFQDLLFTQTNHNSPNQMRLRRKEGPLNTFSNVTSDETHVEILKLIQDLTRGVKVVIKRMNIKTIHNLTGNSSSLTACTH